MTSLAHAEWTTPQPFSLPDLGPGLDGELAERLEAALREIGGDPSVQALVLFGSRATGQARAESDLDLLAVERTPHLGGGRPRWRAGSAIFGPSSTCPCRWTWW